MPLCDIITFSFMINFMQTQTNKLITFIKNVVRRYKLKRIARKEGRVFLFQDFHGKHFDVDLDVTKVKGYQTGKTTFEVYIHPDCIIYGTTEKAPLRFIGKGADGDKYELLFHGTLAPLRNRTND